MMKKTHLVLALLLFLIFVFIFKNIIPALAIFLAALLPDLDLAFLHRKLFHNLFFGFIIGVVLLLYPVLILPFCVGFLSHLALDAFTPMGIWPFWPLGFRIKGPIRTGKIFDYCLFLLFFVLSITLLAIYLF